MYMATNKHSHSLQYADSYYALMYCELTHHHKPYNFIAHVTMCTNSCCKRTSKMYYYRETREEKTALRL